jgi:uncharacterized secreted protein with C-terminal beta-propeller domain
MSKGFTLAVAIAAIAMALPATGWATPTAPKKTLTAFASEEELAAVLKRWAEEAKRRREELRTRMSAQSPAAAAAPQALAAKEAAASMADSVTSVQHAGVDEGGIVKVHGDHLVILRRGRLFTIAIGDKQLKPVSSIDAFGPHVDPGRAWYDEMLISGDTIAIIGSPRRGG